jgi:hypothetical protein
MPYGSKEKSYGTPSPNLLRKLLNLSAMTEEDTKQWPELATAWAGREIEMPEEAAATKSVRPMNWLEEKTVGRDAAGLTWPWGTIALNKKNIEPGQDLGEVLAHELVHVGQNANPLNLLKNAYHTITKGYGSQPREEEAFERTNYRPVRTKDIVLPSSMKAKK